MHNQATTCLGYGGLYETLFFPSSVMLTPFVVKYYDNDEQEDNETEAQQEQSTTEEEE
ncbi:hypothetical protein QW180_26825 [Vibrio sinaloensis]|nr:hypothetical protein [Vibrio sinaloensis]